MSVGDLCVMGGCVSWDLCVMGRCVSWDLCVMGGCVRLVCCVRLVTTGGGRCPSLLRLTCRRSSRSSSACTKRPSSPTSRTTPQGITRGFSLPLSSKWTGQSVELTLIVNY